jgi:Domain of unknown function (DUF4157)
MRARLIDGARVRQHRPLMSARRLLQRCNGRRCPPGTCSHEVRPAVTRRTIASGMAAVPPMAAPPIVEEVVRAPGQPLDSAIRARMESSLGHDFARVRVHSDARAAESAQTVDALAYTVGDHIVFGESRYQTEGSEGRRLLAHELVHVVQQRRGGTPHPMTALEVGAADTPHEREAAALAVALDRPDSSPIMAFTEPVVQRACPPAPSGVGATAPEPFPCERRGPGAVGGSIVLFCRDSVELIDGQEQQLSDIVVDANRARTIELHGNASPDGPSGAYNVNLSCLRAAAFRDRLRGAGVTAPMILFAHGPTTAYGPSASNRNVVVSPIIPAKPPQEAAAPRGINCDRYKQMDVASYMGSPYMTNAFFACITTPDEPHNNCVRACLQANLSTYLERLKKENRPTTRPDYTLEPSDRVLRCHEVWRHHVDCYQRCGCENTFIAFNHFFPMCDREFPPAFTAQSIATFNPCMGSRIDLPSMAPPYSPAP